jgi:putative flippase GtrA
MHAALSIILPGKSCDRSSWYHARMAVDAWHRHLRQGGMFLLVGLAQLAIDTTVFICSTALGVPVVTGNLLGRVSGATLGFWLNGRHTFADNGQARLSPRHQWRFAVMWLSLTAVSSLVLHMAASQLSLQGAWMVKPAIEGVLAIVSFLTARDWVYR